MRNNEIEELPDIWDKLKALKDLRVHSNKIKVLPKSLKYLEKL